MKSGKTIAVVVGVLLVAAIADVKYKGLFYRMLPASIQACLDGVFSNNKEIEIEVKIEV